jgi:hypothetical protein
MRQFILLQHERSEKQEIPRFPSMDGINILADCHESMRITLKISHKWNVIHYFWLYRQDFTQKAYLQSCPESIECSSLRFRGYLCINLSYDQP